MNIEFDEQELWIAVIRQALQDATSLTLDPALVALPTTLKTAANVGGQVVNVSSNVTVNATGGSREQNDALAKQVSQSVEASIRSLVVREIRQQGRPGNLLNHV